MKLLRLLLLLVLSLAAVDAFGFTTKGMRRRRAPELSTDKTSTYPPREVIFEPDNPNDNRRPR
ncbi:hypothetical protein PRIPAC_83275 [Pristionchus pacificus]|uniref:Uncharacterized protein n=1 Tax=Pristionchus pacificus TaxID=54126 RepID=A0A2A6BTH0_PRIPA|nr:hypothetical protein PRIPAC_83275 [Pristionchus pacificus]|eukprot:PDM69061.1 hypothetical protein PRIPAC_47363 [Pristionchus pacificus]